MTAVGQVKRAVMAAIAAAGGAAVESYSVEQLKCYQTAVTAVGAKETAIDESGAIEYLGEKTDEKRKKNQTGRETSRKTDRNAVPCSAAGSFTFDELPFVRR